MKLGESRPVQPFRADPRDCPSCKLELICHPDTGRWVCPSCKFTRDRMHQNLKEITTMELTTTTPAPTSRVTVIDLASRWGVSTYVAKARLLREGVTIDHDIASGQLTVDETDVADWTPDTPKTSPRRPTNQPAAAPEPKDPQTSQIGDPNKVRRLLLALAGIRALADVDNSHPLLAIHALAGYAIQAETDQAP